jgi:hypothetical protein
LALLVIAPIVVAIHPGLKLRRARLATESATAFVASCSTQPAVGRGRQPG